MRACDCLKCLPPLQLTRPAHTAVVSGGMKAAWRLVWSTFEEEDNGKRTPAWHPGSRHHADRLLPRNKLEIATAWGSYQCGLGGLARTFGLHLHSTTLRCTEDCGTVVVVYTLYYGDHAVQCAVPRYLLKAARSRSSTSGGCFGSRYCKPVLPAP